MWVLKQNSKKWTIQQNWSSQSLWFLLRFQTCNWHLAPFHPSKRSPQTTCYLRNRQLEITCAKSEAELNCSWSQSSIRLRGEETWGHLGSTKVKRMLPLQNREFIRQITLGGAWLADQGKL